MRIDSSWAWSSRWASSITRTGVRPRSACSTASASTVWGTGWRGGSRSVPEGGDDLVVDAADPDRRVGQVDDGVPGRVQAGQRGADGDGLPGADLAGDHPDAVLAHAPADPGDGLPVRRVAVQHPGGEVAPERGAGEPEEPLQAVDHNVTSSVVGASVSRSSCPGIWSFVLVGAVLSAGVLPVRAA